MSTDSTITQGIAHFLDHVAEQLARKTPSQRREILADLEAHIHEGLANRAAGHQPTADDLQAVLNEMDQPETYAQTLTPEHQERKQSTKLVILGVLCPGIQIAGLAAGVSGVPVVPAIAGFACIVSFFVIWSNEQSPRWLIRLAGVAAICGLGMIIMEIARAL